MKGHIIINVGNYLEENTQKSRSLRFSCEAFRFQCNTWENYFIWKKLSPAQRIFFLSARSLWERKSIFFCHNYLFVKWVPETMPKCFFRLPVSATVAGDRFFSLSDEKVAFKIRTTEQNPKVSNFDNCLAEMSMSRSGSSRCRGNFSS